MEVLTVGRIVVISHGMPVGLVAGQVGSHDRQQTFTLNGVVVPCPLRLCHLHNMVN